MKVVILAGGLGTRLGEETSIRPKPMVGIGGYPILWHIMKIYSHYGFNDFVVLTGYKQEVIKDYFVICYCRWRFENIYIIHLVINCYLSINIRTVQILITHISDISQHTKCFWICITVLLSILCKCRSSVSLSILYNITTTKFFNQFFCRYKVTRNYSKV